MKLAISTQWNSDFQAIADITMPVMQSYCLKHNYSFYAHFCEMKSPEIVWQRVEDVKTLLAHFDAVLHLDCDMLITNPDISIESIIKDLDSEFIVGSDCNGINDGFSLWKNDEFSWMTLGFLSTAHRCGYTSPQDALRDPRCNVTTTILEQRIANSYITTEYGQMDPRGEWQKGDFLLHLPARSNERRVELFQETLRRLRQLS